jgi:serine protease Do
MSELIDAGARALRRGRRAWMAAGLVTVLAAGLPALPAAAQTRVELPDFTELVERVGPSVVNIRTMERSRNAATPGGGIDPNMEEFFRRFGIPLPGGRGTPRAPGGGNNGDDEPQQRGVGSGFILSADGYVMTNAHVVDGADELLVTLTDKREFKAKVIGADKRTDVAVVKIEATGLPAVKLGDVGKLKVGEWVMAIGSPFGLENSVTAGIVSAKARDTGDYLPFIQTDVAINPGNSGGPLLDSAGRLIGINTAIYSPSGASAGIGFAVPVDTVNRVVPQLIAGGKYVRPALGAAFDEGLNNRLKRALGVDGVVVLRVAPGSAAEAAGLLGAKLLPDGGVAVGDVIIAVDGKTVDSVGKLLARLDDRRVGETVTLKILRDGRQIDVTVTLQPGV